MRNVTKIDPSVIPRSHDRPTTCCTLQRLYRVYAASNVLQQNADTTSAVYVSPPRAL